MKSITELKQEVLRLLEQSGAFADAKLLAAYPAARRDDPLPGPAVAVGVDGVECAPGGLGGYWGEREQRALYGNALLVTLRFDLYAPVLLGGERLHELYEALCDVLLLRPAVPGICKLWCGEITHDRQAAALRLTAKATLRAALTRQDEERTIERIQLQRVSGPGVGAGGE